MLSKTTLRAYKIPPMPQSKLISIIFSLPYIIIFICIRVSGKYPEIKNIPGFYLPLVIQGYYPPISSLVFLISALTRTLRNNMKGKTFVHWPMWRTI